MTTIQHKHLKITKYEHDTVVITSESPDLTFVIDPFQSTGVFRPGGKVDIVFISHDHFDHFSPKDIQTLAGRETVFVFPASILDKVQTFLDVAPERLIPVVPLEEYKIPVKNTEITVMAVPAYNVDKRSPQGNLYHRKDKEYVGFLLDIGGSPIYFVGDSDPIPEMEALAGMVEVLLIPVSGVYVMDVEEAVELTQRLQPQLAIPLHYGSVVGDAGMGERYKQRVGEEAPQIHVEV
ncbi:MBL fold metallo-hydrolase [bacterium]|nr:MBL fold metallo-hydrolase [bacterium]